MAEQDQVEFEDDDLDDIDDDVGFTEPSEDPDLSTKRDEAAEQRRIAARREIERRNELKALQSELDEWGEDDY